MIEEVDMYVYINGQNIYTHIVLFSQGCLWTLGLPGSIR